MDVLLVGIGAALATIAALVVMPAALAALRARWQERTDWQSRDLRTSVDRATSAARANDRERQGLPVAVMDATVRTRPPAPELIHWTRAVGENAAIRADPETRNLVGRSGPDVFDVQGHADEAEDPFDGAGPQVADLSVEARSVLWRTDGSMDCPGCASSRLRGARFCVRCGRRMA